MAPPKVRFLHKTLTLPEDVVNLLNGEDNQSALVADLLNSYFGTNSTAKEIDAKIEKTERQLAALRIKRAEAESKIAPDILEKYRAAYLKHTDPPKNANGKPTYTKWTPDEREAWLEESARRLGIGVEELKEKLEVEE